MKKIYTIILLTLIVINGKSQTINGNYLDINNVKAPVGADGGLFWYGNTNSEVPMGSGKSTLYTSALWLGGYDAGGQLHLAAQTYRQGGTDFWPGPVDPTGVYNSAYDSTYNRVWKIKQCDINTYFYWVTGGSVGTNPLIAAGNLSAMEVINSWPAFGINGQSMAPFLDYNQDGLYDPANGDVPKIRGDEEIYFIYNDARGPHTESGGDIIGLEIQGMAYEYACPNDSLLYNTVFTHYKIINRGSIQLDSSFIGNWTDMDIGDYADDYSGCDVTRGTYFGYNGDANDGTGQSTAYGANPPAEAVVCLVGPRKDQNGIDDPANSSPNGLLYGDTIIDNELLGMSRFMAFNNSTGIINGNPSATDDFYQYLSGSWKNGMPWTYGGDGTTASVNTDYMFPGTSDPSGFGTNMNIQPPWDETSAALPPQDIRGIGSFGPFTLYPGGVEYLDFAYIYAKASFGGNLYPLAILKNEIDSLKSRFCTCNYNPTCSCSPPTGITEINHPASINIYPNPATDNMTINYTSISKNYTINIYDGMGSLVKTIACKTTSVVIPVGELAKGIYLLNVVDGSKSSVKRFVKQ